MTAARARTYATWGQVREKGAGGVLRAVLRRLPITVYRHQRHIWAEVDLATAPRVVELPEGWDIVRGSRVDLPVLDRLGIGFEAAPRLLDAGHRWYLIRDHGRPVYSAWMFTREIPTDATPSGWITMPADIVNIEDSYLDPAYRGRGFTHFCLPAVNAQAIADGVRRTITMMQADNTAVLVATARTGWRAFAVVDVHKFGLARNRTDWRNRRPDGPLLRTRIRVLPPGDDGVLPVSPVAAELNETLRGGLLAAAR